MVIPTVKKAKILYVITKSNFGGAQKYVYDLSVSLPQERFEVVVAIGGEGVLSEKLRDAGVRTISLPSLARDIHPLRDFASFYALVRMFLAERPDVVHLNSAKASGLGALAARVTFVPKIIFTAHGWAFNEDRSPLSRFVIKLFSWMTVLLSHTTIAVSNAVQKDAGKWPFVRGKIVCVNNGVSRPQFFTREAARTVLANITEVTIAGDAFVFGTIAELHNNKGLPYAIRAFAQIAARHPNIFYFILGDGEKRELLYGLIKEYGLARRVFLLGFVRDASRYLQAFDCFVLPSIKEGFPYVLLEAGLASLPVVATAVGGIPEIIENKKTGSLVPARDTEALARAAEEISVTSKERTALGRALHDKVVRNFSLEKMVAETIVFYTVR